MPPVRVVTPYFVTDHAGNNINCKMIMYYDKKALVIFETDTEKEALNVFNGIECLATLVYKEYFEWMKNNRRRIIKPQSVMYLQHREGVNHYGLVKFDEANEIEGDFNHYYGAQWTSAFAETIERETGRTMKEITGRDI